MEVVVYAPDERHGKYPLIDGIGEVAGEVRVARDRDLKVGEDLVWFYPSTEWESPRPFECLCGAERCIGMQRGSKFLERYVLEGYFVNEHVRLLMEAREGEAA